MALLPPLTASDLAISRATAEATMADTCTFERDAAIYDNEGGLVATSGTVSTSRCGLHAVSGGAEQATADRLGWTAAYAVRLPLAIVVQPADRLVINGRTFEVGAVLANGVQATAQTVICQEHSA